MKTYTRIIENQKYSFTAYTTKAETRKQLNTIYNPVLVEIEEDGELYYDVYPAGHPLPADAIILEHWDGNRWKSGKREEVDE